MTSGSEIRMMNKGRFPCARTQRLGVAGAPVMRYRILNGTPVSSSDLIADDSESHRLKRYEFAKVRFLLLITGQNTRPGTKWPPRISPWVLLMQIDTPGGGFFSVHVDYHPQSIMIGDPEGEVRWTVDGDGDSDCTAIVKKGIRNSHLLFCRSLSPAGVPASLPAQSHSRLPVQEPGIPPRRRQLVH